MSKDPFGNLDKGEPSEKKYDDQKDTPNEDPFHILTNFLDIFGENPFEKEPEDNKEFNFLDFLDPFHALFGKEEATENPFEKEPEDNKEFNFLDFLDPFHAIFGKEEATENPFEKEPVKKPGFSKPPVQQTPPKTAAQRYQEFNQQLDASRKFMQDVQSQNDYIQNPYGQQNIDYQQNNQYMQQRYGNQRYYGNQNYVGNQGYYDNQPYYGFQENIYGNVRNSQYYYGMEKSYMQALGEKLFEKDVKVKVAPEMVKERDSKLLHLKEKINKSLKNYRKYEKKSKKGALTFRLLSSALAAIVTVFLGINITDSLRSLGLDWWLNTIALIISAFISIIGVIQGFFDADQLYVKYTDTANKLEQLSDMIHYLEQGNKDYITVADINAIKMEYDRIIESTFSYEMEIRAEDDITANRIKQQGKTQAGY